MRNGRRQVERDTREASPRTSGARKRAALAREKARVRRQVFSTGAIISALFGTMIVYIVVYANSNSKTLFENDYNTREETLLEQNVRGKIYSSDGEILAETVQDQEGNEVRSYPYSNLFSHIIGYTYKGGSGVEQLEDYELTHSDISLSEKAAYDSANEKYPGNDVYTTLDYSLQKAAYDALGDNNGAVIVTEVDSGNILCMVSKPDFDPNTIEEDWESLGADADSGTLVNRVTQGLYAPGSTFKIFDAVELMNENMSEANSFSYNCVGYDNEYTLEDGQPIHCYHWTAHGQVDLEKAFAKSCNSAFVNIGNSLNRTSFASLLNEMMFGESLPYDLPTGISSYVLTSETSTEDVTQLSIGQGSTLMTPMHLNMVTAAIANGGTVHKDQIIASVKTGTGSVISTTKTEDYRTVMTSEIAAKMREMMRDVVLEGTATKLSSRPYNPCGKTGSAEIVTGQSTSHAWFTGFAPLEDPEIAITVIVEGAGSGGTSAVPVARSVMDVYFDYTPSEGEDDDANYVMVGVDETSSTSSDPSESTGTTVTLNMDTNGDGIMDAFDANGDGIADAYDLDGDGIPESSTSTPSTGSAAAAAASQDASADQTGGTITDTTQDAAAGTAADTSNTDATAGTAVDPNAADPNQTVQ
jgi:cell division protein FtsI/penicillin-binding protein 2